MASDENTSINTSTETVMKLIEYALSLFFGERFFQRAIILVFYNNRTTNIIYQLWKPRCCFLKCLWWLFHLAIA